MKVYKGFNKDMTCRGFQFEDGKEYAEENAKLCEKGFHACEAPIDCFRYYSPSESVYYVCELDEVSDERKTDSKVCGKKIKIGAKLTIADIVRAQLEYVNERTETKDSATGTYGASSATGNYGASSATGDYGASSATGNYGASSATGNYGASSATGDYGASSATGTTCGASSATGDYGASSATGTCGASSATGNRGASSATGDYGASSATGKGGVAVTTGCEAAATAGSSSAIAVAWGAGNRAKGVLGAYIVLAEWKRRKLIDVQLIQIDGETYKPDVFYRLKNGKVVEAK